MMILLAVAGLFLAVIPAAMFIANLPLFQSGPGKAGPGKAGSGKDSQDNHVPSKAPNVSVLIPARDEAAGIERCVTAALASDHVNIQVIVLDDHSTDATAQIVQRLQSNDDRVKYLLGGKLPDGWNGKQYACKQLSEAAEYDEFVFMDADVRLKPHALHQLLKHKSPNQFAPQVADQIKHQIALLSAFPHQETGTILEKWLIPMMHFILLGYLPFKRMRESPHPAYASGCGQLFMTKRADYITAGTHAAIANSRHDGLKLPRAYREQGLMTDVVDGSDLAECRMYHNASQVIRGVLKNATEAIASPRLILPFSILLLGSTLLPIWCLWVGWQNHDWIIVAIASLSILVGHLPRAIAAVKFRQSWLGVVCHAPATILFVMLQWTAFSMSLTGNQVSWRGRT